MRDREEKQRDDGGCDGVERIGREEGSESGSGQGPAQRVIEEGVVSWGTGDDFEAVDACGKIAAAFVHGFDEAINFPKASEIEAWSVEALNVDALITFVV